MSGRAARLTAAGIGGLHVWSLEDVDGAAFLTDHFDAVSSRSTSPASLLYGRLVDGEDVLDEVLIRVIDERRLEISLHGSAAVDARIAELLRGRGLDIEPPGATMGERAIATEAREALTRCRSAQGARVLLHALDGALDRAIESIITAEAVTSPVDALTALLDRAAFGCALLSPPRVVLSGPVNAGKSTLFNRLAATDRVITSSEAGTTRDAVEAPIEIGGFPFRLVDTAGVRATEDAVEREGIQRAAEARRSANIVVAVRAAGDAVENMDAATDGTSLIRVLNKVDRLDGGRGAAATGELPISALSGEGVEALASRILAASPFHDAPPARDGVPFNDRQVRALESARARWDEDPEGARRVLEALIRRGVAAGVPSRFAGPATRSRGWHRLESGRRERET